MPPMTPPPGRHHVRAAFVLLAFFPAVARSADPAPDAHQAVSSALAIQDAMRQGRDQLHHGQAKAAVEVLEAQLPRINGSAAYLALLREAYSAYVKELQLAHQDELCEVYQQRLKLIEKTGRSDSKAAPQRPPAPAAARGVSGDEDPLQQSPRRPAAPDAAELAQAEQAFAAGRYREADELFARAAAAGPLSYGHQSQWAYCKLYVVVDQLRQPGPPAAGLERDVTAALRLAEHDPGLTAFGRQVLDRVRQ